MLAKKQIKEILRSVFVEKKELGIQKIGLFGSYVRNKANEKSDVDILIDLAPESQITLFSLIELEQLLCEKLNTKADLVIKTSLKPHLGEKILSEVEYV